MVCVRIPICLNTAFVFKYVTLILHFANHPSCIKVSVLLWEFLQGLNSAVHYLHGSCGRDKIFVAVRVLVVIVALVQVTPEDIYCYSGLWIKWWKIYLKYQMNGNIVCKGLNMTYEKGKNHLPLVSEFPYNRPFSLVDFVCPIQISVLEITVGHRTLSDQISRMSGQFHIMIGHNDHTSHQHILSYILQGFVSQ